MKKAASILILITLLALSAFGVDYFLTISSYNELRKGADSPVLDVVAIGQREQEFLDEVLSSWKPHDVSSPDNPMIKICELGGFEPTVGGLHAMLTHKVPPFSIFDKKQNIKEAGRAGGLATLKPIAKREKAYWKKGVLYMMISEDALEYYEDTDIGVRHIIYKK